MTDGVIKSTGNSRYLKSVANFMTLFPTYEDFAAALVAGNLPIDLNGINPDGWNQQATPLNKANLLADTTGSALGLGSTGTVNTALSKLKTLYDNLAAQKHSYSGTRTGTGTLSYSITFPFEPALVFISESNQSFIGWSGSSSTYFGWSHGFLWLKGLPTAKSSFGSNGGGYSPSISQSGTLLSVYFSGTPNNKDQAIYAIGNANGTPYKFMGIG